MGHLRQSHDELSLIQKWLEQAMLKLFSHTLSHHACFD
uniref:Uncharacterized protein n=1 Tax=Setaria italica TaxID=4555 RepID=K3Y3W8_SETIT